MTESELRAAAETIKELVATPNIVDNVQRWLPRTTTCASA